MATFLTPDRIRLAYEDEGSGPAVLCLSGLTRTGRDFDYLRPHLPGLRLIRPDYRGRGRSEPADPGTYTVAQEAADQIALLDHLGLERVRIIGSSRGGLIAMALALGGARARLAGVALNDVGPVLEPAALSRIAAQIGQPPPFATQAEMAAAMPRLNPGFAGVAPERWRQEVAHRTRQVAQGLALTYDPRLREAVLAAFSAPLPADPWPAFDALAGLPLCLLRGENSDLLSRATADEMQRRRPDMIRAEIPGRGHIPFLDEPESLDALRRWLELTP